MNITEPIVVEQRVEGSKAEFVLDVPHDLDYFTGHFPGAPILPGVVQIKWAMSIADRCLGVHGELTGLTTLKFQQVIRPCDRLSLVLEYAEKPGKLRFAFSSAQGRLSSGCILLRTS